MFTVIITEKGGAQRRMEFDKNEVTIGRVQGNDIILPKGNVSKRHSRIVLKDNRFIVVDLKSTNGTYVNGRKITSPLVVKPGDKVYIGDFILTLDEPAGAAVGADAGGYAPPPPDAMAPPMMAPPEPEPLAPPPEAAPRPRRPTGGGPPPLRGPAPGGPAARANAPPPLPGRDDLPGPMTQRPPGGGMRDDVAAERFPLDEEPSDDHSAPAPMPQMPMMPATPHPEPMAPAPQAMAAPAAAVAVPRPRPPSQQRMPAAQQAPAPQQQPQQPQLRVPVVPPSEPVRAPIPPQPPLAASGEGALRAVIGRLSLVFDVHNADAHALHDQERWAQAQSAVEAIVADLSGERAIDGVDPGQLAGAALREAVGLGALEPLMSDASVREIVVEGPRRIVADYGNGLEPVDATFSSSTALMTIARRLVAQAGDFLDPARPIHEATLPYGPHVTVVQPPVAVRGPVIEIRRTGRGLTADELVDRGTLSREMLDALKEAVEARKTIVVAGAVGSGVTTVLGALATLVEPRERLVTVEDVPDLALDREHVVSLATGGPGSGVRLKDVLHQGARLRADRLVVDDVTGADLFEVLTVVGSRRSGSLVGVHTGSDVDPLDAMRMFVKMAGHGGELTGDALISRSIQVVVHIVHGDDGRKVVAISEMVTNGSGPTSRALFVHENGEFKAA